MGHQSIPSFSASCLTLEINEFRCYEQKIEESEKWELNSDWQPFPLFSLHKIQIHLAIPSLLCNVGMTPKKI